jgi:hypothetical protein
MKGLENGRCPLCNGMKTLTYSVKIPRNKKAEGTPFGSESFVIPPTVQDCKG